MPKLPTWTTPAVRQPGWEHGFAAFVAAQRDMPFAWGRADCLTAIADLCAALTGRNPLPKALRRYTTERGASRLMISLGFADIEAALAQCFPAVAPALARRGDCGIVMTHVDGQPAKAAVIVLGPTVLGRGPAGAIIRPRRDLVSAFAIGSL